MNEGTGRVEGGWSLSITSPTTPRRDVGKSEWVEWTPYVRTGPRKPSFVSFVPRYRCLDKEVTGWLCPISKSEAGTSAPRETLKEILQDEIGRRWRLAVSVCLERRPGSGAHQLGCTVWSVLWSGVLDC